jgi:ribonuclease P protein component
VESLKRQEIIRKKRDFEILFSNGMGFQSRSLRILWRPSPERKAGFLVGKRLGIAVERNRVRRILREAYRKNRQDLSDKIELLIIAKREARELRYAPIEREFISLIRRAGLMADEGNSNPAG